jgi:hypothetical protein
MAAQRGQVARRREEPVVDDAETQARRGLTRREVIRASAVAGAAVWTAPVIIDSLSSPAAAGSQQKISCSWFYVVYKKPGDNTVYFTTADDSSAACANAHPPNNQGPNVKTCDGVTYVSADGTDTITYGPSDTPATYETSSTCGNSIQILGDTIQAINDVVLLAAFSHKGGTQCSQCPSPLNTKNNSVGICSGVNSCDAA